MVRLGMAAVLLLCAGCSSTQTENDAQLHAECVATARRILGENAQLLRFGHLAKGTSMDGIAVITIPDYPNEEGGFIISRLIVLRHEGTAWNVVFDAGERILNPAGYVGPAPDDDADYIGYRLMLVDQGPDGKGGITLWLWRLDSSDEDESQGLEIGMNRSTGRYQEFDYQVTQAFVAESKLRAAP